MANLLNGVNDVLKKVHVISETRLLSSLTNSGKQTFIDNAVQSWGEAVDQLYSKANIMKPKQAEEDSITLIAGQRSYDLPCDLVQIRWPLHEEDEGFYINKYPGGYEELKNIQSQPDNYTGHPSTAAISPIDGTIYIDSVPTSSEAGYVYKFQYWKDLTLSKAGDLFPFSNTVYRAMIPVVAELWKFNMNQRTSSDVSKINYGRAVRALKQEPADTAWIKRGGNAYSTSPLGYDPFTE